MAGGWAQLWAGGWGRMSFWNLYSWILAFPFRVTFALAFGVTLALATLCVAISLYAMATASSHTRGRILSKASSCTFAGSAVVPVVSVNSRIAHLGSLFLYIYFTLSLAIFIVGLLSFSLSAVIVIRAFVIFSGLSVIHKKKWPVRKAHASEGCWCSPK